MHGLGRCCASPSGLSGRPGKEDHSSRLGRVLRLTLLAPEIIEAIMEGRQPAGMTMAGLLMGFPVVWAEQRAVLGA